MLKRNLKKYKLMYRANLVANKEIINNCVFKTLTVYSKYVTIANVEKFEDMLYMSENSPELWDNNYLQYCNLEKEEERKRMATPTFNVNKAYLFSDDTVYDMVTHEKIHTLFKNSGQVFSQIKDFYQFEFESAQLKKIAENYIDDVIEIYEKNNNHTLKR